MTRHTAEECTDIDEELEEAKEDIRRLKSVLQRINAMCNAPHWNAERRWTIERLSARMGHDVTEEKS